MGMHVSRFFLGILPVFLLTQVPVSGLARDVDKGRKPQVQVGDAASKQIDGSFSSGDWIGTEKEVFDDKILLVVYWSLEDVNREQWQSQLREIRTTYRKNPDFRILSICVSTDVEAW